MAKFVTVEQLVLQKSRKEEEEIEACYKKYNEFVWGLPKAKGWATEFMFQYKGYWFPTGLQGMLWTQDHFKARISDVYLISFPKCGTTWLKGLLFSIVNRSQFSSNDHPLLTHSSHQCVPSLEHQLFGDIPIGDPEILPSPRVLSSHFPFALLPTTITDPGCKIVYICRDPKDAFVSMWHFMNKRRSAKTPSLGPLPLDEAFDFFCMGLSPRGPFWDHMLGYWKASLENPNNILFLKYEDMKRETLLHVKKVAMFLGCPFTLEEEENGSVQEIINLCSFEKMSNLEVNKTGKTHKNNYEFNAFFRNGEIGDWKNHLTPEMIKRIDQITLEKFAGSGLKF